MSDFQDTKYLDYDLHPAKPWHLYRSHVPAVPEPRREVRQPDAHYAVHLGVMLEGELHLELPGYEDVRGPGQVWLTGAWEPHWGLRGQSTSRLVLVTLLPEALGAFDALGDLDWAAPFRAAPALRPAARTPALRSRCLALGEAMWQAGGVLGRGPAAGGEERGGADDRRQRGGTAGAGLGESGDALAARPRAACRVWMAVHDLLLTLQEAEPVAVANPADRAARERVQPAVDLLRRGRGEPVRVDEAATACGLGRSRFAELFRQVMGTGFGAWETDARLAGAAADLRRTREPLKHVAAVWGFYDVSHFHRAFRRRFGRSPAAYRQGD